MSVLLPMRDYQRAAVEAAEAAWERGITRPATVLPTGAGKTVVFAHQGQRFRQRNPGKRVLYVAHRTELIEQAAAKLRDVMPGERIGIVKATRNETLAPHVVCSVQTLAQPTRRMQLMNVGLVVIDEAHHAAAASYVTLLEHFGAFGTKPYGEYGRPGAGAVALGVTATMIRGDDLALGDIWQDIVYTRSIADMIRDRWLVRPVGKRVRVADLDLSGVRKLAGDYSGAQLGAALEGSLAPEAVAKAMVEHAPDRPTILFAPLVSTAGLFRDALREAGFTAELVYDKTPREERRRVLNDFRAGKVQVLCNAMLFTEGTDLPNCSCIVIARPTLNPGLFIQMVGRGLRPSPTTGKTDCLVLDVVGASARHRLVLSPELFGTESVIGTMFDEDEAAEAAEQGDTLELDEALPGELGAGAPEPEFVNGMMISEEVDLFHGSDQVWLTTAAGVWFLAPGDRYIAVVPGRHGGYDVVTMHQTRLGDSAYIAEGIQSLDYAMGHAADAVTAVEKRRTAREQSWRAQRPDRALRTMAKRMGIAIDPDAMAGEVRNACMVAAATWRIDSRLPAYLQRPHVPPVGHFHAGDVPRMGN
jgi:superfamily II DNA or RNA helicase